MGPAAVGFSPGSEPGIFGVSTNAGFAILSVVGTVDGSAQSFVPFLWAVGDPSARLLVPSSMLTMRVSGGWLTWIDGHRSGPATGPPAQCHPGHGTLRPRLAYCVRGLSLDETNGFDGADSWVTAADTATRGALT